VKTHKSLFLHVLKELNQPEEMRMHF
jgi:hypothetical protein